MSSFRQRALVTLTLTPLGIYIIYVGGWVYFVPIAAVLLVAVFEFNHIARNIGRTPSLWVMIPTVVALWLDAQLVELDFFAPALFIGMFCLMLHMLWRYEQGQGTQIGLDWLTTMGGILLLGWLGGHFFSIRALEPNNALRWTAIAMISAWSADSFAYLVGRQIGRHKMTPRLSPKKSYEGYAAGVLFGTLIPLLFGWGLGLEPLWLAGLMGATIALLSTAGDLSISLLKREAQIKDSGSLFPATGERLTASTAWSGPSLLATTSFFT